MIKDGIKIEEWEGHFKEVSEGIGWRVSREEGRRKQDEEEEEKTSREEIDRVRK